MLETLKPLILILRKWILLIIAAAALGGGLAYLYTRSQTPTYQSKVKLLVGDFSEIVNPSPQTIQSAQQLAQLYVELTKTGTLLQQAIDTLGLPVTVSELRKNITVKNLRSTSILEVGVTYESPEEAAQIANQIATLMIANSPSNLTVEEQNRLNFLNDQITFLKGVIDDSRQQINEIDTQLADTRNQDRVGELTLQRNTLINQVNQATTNVMTILATVSSLQQRTNTVRIIEQAIPVTDTVGISSKTAIILGVAFGAFLAAGTATVIEYSRSTFKTPDEVRRILQLPVLGMLTRQGGRRKLAPQDFLVTLAQPFSPVAEGYRTLQAKLFWGPVSELGNVYAITSPGMSEGKSFIAANLAVSVATSGLRILLIDADLRRPNIHQIFKLERGQGLAEFLQSKTAHLLADTLEPLADPQTRIREIATIADVSAATVTRVLRNQEKVTDESRQKVEAALQQINNQRHPETESLETTIQAELQPYIRPTSVSNLYVMTAGSTLTSPAELFESHLPENFFQRMAELADFDLIIFDTPPCLAVADSYVLAARFKAGIVLVIEANRTTQEAAQRAKELFADVENSLKGVILNKINAQDAPYRAYTPIPS